MLVDNDQDDYFSEHSFPDVHGQDDAFLSLFGFRIPRRSAPLVFFFGALLCLVVLAVVVGSAVTAIVYTQALENSSSSSGHSRPKNIIFMIGDGFGPVSAAFAREIQRVSLPQSYLIIDSALAGHIATSSASSFVTDSAAGATAYSCAQRTNNRYVGVLEDGTPCGTLMEAAMLKGMRGGLVSTSRVTHATPASFSAHVRERDDEDLIAQQQMDYSRPQVILGGGLEHFDPTLRSDGKDLIAQAGQLGYHMVYNTSQLDEAKKLPLLGLFANSHMPFAIDRNPEKEPSLANMTRKALELLNHDNDDGFFLMVEGSRIDMASHNNDPGAHYYAIQSYMDAIKVASEFASDDGRTLVISVADHETGGLSLGSNKNDGSYPDYLWYPDRVLKQTASVEVIAQAAMADGADDVETLLNEHAGVDDLTDEEKSMLSTVMQTGDVTSLGRAIGKVISYRARVGWTTWGHTGVDINMYVWSDDTGVTASLQNRVVKNSDLGAQLFDALDLDQNAADDMVKDIAIEPSSPSARRGTTRGDAVRYHH